MITPEFPEIQLEPEDDLSTAPGLMGVVDGVVKNIDYCCLATKTAPAR